MLLADKILTPAGDAGLNISVPKRAAPTVGAVLFNGFNGTPTGNTPTAPGNTVGFFLLDGGIKFAGNV